MALHAALTGLGISRKFCRQLRAELHLEEVTRQGRRKMYLRIRMDDSQELGQVRMYLELLITRTFYFGMDS